MPWRCDVLLCCAGGGFVPNELGLRQISEHDQSCLGHGHVLALRARSVLWRLTRSVKSLLRGECYALRANGIGKCALLFFASY